MIDILCKEYETSRSDSTLSQLLIQPQTYTVFTKLLRWYHEGLYSLSIFLYYVLQLFGMNTHIFIDQGRTIIQSLFEYLYDQDYIDEEWVMNHISVCTTKEEQAFHIYYLLLPCVLYKDEDHINETFARIACNLTFLKTCLVIQLTISECIRFYPVNVTYFYTYMGIPIKEVLQLYSTFMYQLCPELSYSYKKETKEDDTLTIGCFSQFLFKNHSVSRDRIGIIKHLCRRYKVYLFIPYEIAPQEFYTLCMKDVTPYQIVTVSPHTIKERMKECNLDILLYPELGMCPYSYLYAHMRLAPVQMTTWGHSETSGISTIDYYISSKYFETDESPLLYSETVLPLSSLSTYYYNLDYLKIQRESRDTILQSYQYDTKYTYYGIFQNMYKFHPCMVSFISDVCKKDSNARFVIIVSSLSIMKRHLQHVLFDVYNRIHLISNQSNSEYCRLLQAMDILIDTYPFGGCNTSLDAFYLHKMVMTYPSQQLNGRFTYGFYTYMNISEPICSSYEEWIEKSVFYATHATEKNRVEETIREKSVLLFRDQKSRVDWENCLLFLHKRHSE